MLKYEAEVLTNLKSQLNSALNLLKELAQKDLETIRTDPHLLSSAKYNLIVAIESAIDLSNHLISKNGFRVPEDFSDSFRVLAEQGILNDNFVGEKLIAMALFRNRLVHQYWAVDTDLLYDILQQNLDDFEIFLHQITKNLR
ncbi:MAG: DUF86 domain-containing protein [Bacillota bacterium]|nr:DUF86 domain-containing protein [Bacillota bacterium]